MYDLSLLAGLALTDMDNDPPRTIGVDVVEVRLFGEQLHYL
jgi:hypothetical protein